MPDTFLLRDWQAFYQLAGTAAATLIGLIFLAISLGARLVPAENTSSLRAFVVPIVIHFGAVHVLSALMLIPVYTRLLLGLTLVGAGLVGPPLSASGLSCGSSPNTLPVETVMVAVPVTCTRS
jgi:hypothetical protein